ncbi:MAG: proteasome assembly chaperone family protein [archaeon]|nr:proteasome assembly chaperone family protein [archaeon]
MGNGTTIKFDFMPDLKKPILVEGLPGVGNVGKIAADHLCEKLGGKKFATVYSESFPPQVTLDKDGVVSLACNELYYVENVNGKDLMFLRGEYQGSTPEGQYLICEDIMKDVFLKMDVSYIYTLGGYGTGQIVETPRVLGAVSDISLKQDLIDNGVVFSSGEPAGGIVGASALFVAFGKMYNIPAACVMGETSGYFVDHKSAIAILGVLESIFGVSTDKKDLEAKSQQIDELTAKVREIEGAQSAPSDLRYIG